ASGLFARIATVRAGILLPLVLTVIFVGAYQGSESWGDLYSVVIFGTLGWLMKHLNWPRPPLILGFVLGGIFERYFFISTEIYGAAWVMRPVVIGVLALALWVVVPALKNQLRDVVGEFRRFSRSHLRVGGEAAFSLAIIAVVAIAVLYSLAWPEAARFVPQSAAWISLFFLVLNLSTELFVPKAVPVSAAGDPHTRRFAGIDAAEKLAPAVFRTRALRYFGWLAAFLVAGGVFGMLPALFLFVLLQMRFEFREGWGHALAASSLATLAIYLLFDRTFSLPWPQSLIGDLFPTLRDASGLI
ncbi:MAG: tripartite tricarboxylate transporter permease, partial [Stellaceae bacterium]